ncbi:alpha/beta hydrolase [Paenibacillus sp. SC116]|uniref:alpha/beta fold hydrolase n=1 Tax=Paenibacillus sp. SC116 TaxID=2968986 RepID=UPI00215AF0B9|nr:alpha/beta hydrolase [Paenibacillus sp. SC116]MCR8846516.1 alpha/beta hydrolase [Paenibacillus sp. SC116]
MNRSQLSVNDSYIWIHGWGASEQLWHHAAKALPDAAHHYVSFRDCDSSDEMAAEIMERVATVAVNSQRCHLVGWSMGGMLAIEAAAKWLREAGSGMRSEEEVRPCDAGSGTGSGEGLELRGEESSIRSGEGIRLCGEENGIRNGESKELHKAGSGEDMRLREVISNARSRGNVRLRQPNEELLASLVLVGSTLRFVAPTSTEGWPLRVLQRMRQRLAAAPEQTLREFAVRLLAPAEWQQHEPLEATLIERFQQPGFTPAGLDAGLAYLASANLTDAWAQLCAAQLPVLWLHGEQDPLVPIGAQAEARRLAGPNARSVEYRRLTGQGHVPFLTHPREWDEEVSRWHEQFQLQQVTP